MKISHVPLIFISLLVCLFSTDAAFGRAMYDPAHHKPIPDKSGILPILNDDDMRKFGVHDAGDLVLNVWNAYIDGYGSYIATMIDPETGEPALPNAYPKGSKNVYLYSGGLWVGGIADTDTLVTTAITGWFLAMEFIPENESAGGIHRSGNFADDEYVSVTVDTNPDITSYPYDHIPLGLEIAMTSRTWADSLYDDFILVDCVIKNIGDKHIRDGWIGIFRDDDIYDFGESYNFEGYADDFSGSLDTLLDDGDPDSRTLIAYAIDDDGDPGRYLQWDDSSVTGAIAAMMLDCSVPVERINFNWWVSNGNADLDFGPRQVGTPEDPFYDFENGNLGTPVYDDERYYILSHPERDYNQLELMVHDSSDGWVPPRVGDMGQLRYDTKSCLSFGSFDLSPGDSVSLTYALVFAEGLHVNADDFVTLWNPLAPEIYQASFDFSELLTHCRRADSVYKSGYLLPHPGPPAGMRVVDYDDGFIEIAWHPSVRSDLAGYRVYMRDSTYGSNWYGVSPGLITDTTFHVSIFEPNHVYNMAVSLTDTLGRESGRSRPVSVLPCVPHEPKNLEIALDGVIPEVTWQPGVDTAYVVYMIYRSAWSEGHSLYDSTMSLRYRDYGAESGVRYHYRVSARNVSGHESNLIGPVSALPMALDQGILYCDQNRFYMSSPPLYPQKYTQRLYTSVASIIPMTYVSADDSMITFKEMSHYSIVIIDEGCILRTIQFPIDSLALYLSTGGKAVLMKPAFNPIGTSIHVSTFGEGSFKRDIFKLDSIVTGAMVISGGGMVGDLVGVTSLLPEYPSLAADTMKLKDAIIPIYGYIPAVGYMYPTAEAEPIYMYISSNPDTVSHAKTAGMRYLGDDYSIVWLTCPLSLMREPNGFNALKQALVDLGGDVSCGDANMNGLVSVGDAITVINYLYRDGPPPADDWRADVDCTGDITLADAVMMINYVFSRGWLACCPRF